MSTLTTVAQKTKQQSNSDSKPRMASGPKILMTIIKRAIKPLAGLNGTFARVLTVTGSSFEDVTVEYL